MSKIKDYIILETDEFEKKHGEEAYDDTRELARRQEFNSSLVVPQFREKREKLRDKNEDITGLSLTDTLKNYAQTGSEYTKILNQIITQNRLTDFELVKLVNSVKEVELKS